MILISNGRVIDPSCDIDGEFDVLIEGEKIKDIAPRGAFSEMSYVTEVDAKGMWVIPGLIDLHVHLREPGQEWKETVLTGSRAAILGGYTSICCMPNTDPAIHSEEIVRYIIDKGREANLARVLPIGAVSVDRLGKELAPLSELAEAGCVAFSDDGDPVYNAGLMRRALEWCRMIGVPISCHEEDKSISGCGCMNESALSTKLGLTGLPGVAEDVMVARDIELAREANSPVHFCHVSTARSVELIRRAKNDNIPVTAEVTPHHLVMTEQAVAEYDTYSKMSPPLRKEEDRQALIAGLCDGTLDAVASDHAPHEDDVKKIAFEEAAMGILGLQTSMPVIFDLVHEGVLPLTKAIDVLSTGPARAFRLNAGTLQKGSPADVALVSPDKKWTFGQDDIVSISTNSPFIGRQFQGAVHTVFVGGEVKLQNGKICI